MRVTNKMMTDQAVYNITQRLQQLESVQEKISSGKEVNKPSDNPAGMAKILDYRKNLAAFNQYERNIGVGKSWLNASESALDHANEIVNRAREIAIAQSNATATKATREIARKELENLVGQMLQLANTKLGDRYIFGGFKTEQPPFDQLAAYQGDEGQIRLEIRTNDYIDVNIPGDLVFGKALVGLSQLNAALGENVSKEISGSLAKLDDGSQQILQQQAFLGAKTNRLESVENILSQAKTNYTQLLSETEEADVAKTVTDLSSQQLAYQAILASTAKVIQSTLLDFLR